MKYVFLLLSFVSSNAYPKHVTITEGECIDRWPVAFVTKQSDECEKSSYNRVKVCDSNRSKFKKEIKLHRESLKKMLNSLVNFEGNEDLDQNDLQLPSHMSLQSRLLNNDQDDTMADGKLKHAWSPWGRWRNYYTSNSSNCMVRWRNCVNCPGVRRAQIMFP